MEDMLIVLIKLSEKIVVVVACVLPVILSKSISLKVPTTGSENPTDDESVVVETITVATSEKLVGVEYST